MLAAREETAAMQGLDLAAGLPKSPGASMGVPAPQYKINRYLIQGELGRGAMGAVYEAVDPVIGRTVALKVLHAPSSGDAAEAKSLEDRLFREASSAGRLAHPGIVTVFDVGKEGHIAFIAMERVEGPTLLQMMKERKLERIQILEILWQCAAALDYAHGEGIIHRDIKPANIMLHKGTQAKVADFGIAKVSAMTQLTVAGTILGTPSYMSPEQIQNAALTGASDQFSLAVVAYELLTGTRPFERETVPALMLAIVNGERPSASAVDRSLPPIVDEVLRMALAKSPGGRFGNCTAFVNALGSALGFERTLPGNASGIQTRSQAPIASPPPPLPPPPPPRAASAPNRTGPSTGVIVLVGVILLLLAAAWPVYRYIFPKPLADKSSQVTTQPDSAPNVVIPLAKPAVGAPVISLFTAEPDRVTPGSTATLRWWVVDATDVSIDQNIGNVAAKGSIEVKPEKETTYTLTAASAGGKVTSKVVIGVGADAPTIHPENNPVSGPETAPADPARGAQLYDQGMAKRRAGANAEALPLFQEAANLGDPRAMVLLAAYYAQGIGVAKDLNQTAEWLRKAAAAGDAVAMDGLGQLYANGQGVGKDPAQAEAWFRKAVAKGNAPAMYHLAMMLENGSGPVAKNTAEAASLYQQAASAGYIPAKSKVSGLSGQALTSIDPPAIVENRSVLYRLNGSGFSAATTVHTDVPSSIGSKEGQRSDYHPVAIGPNGAWLKIYISIPPVAGQNTVKLTVKNPDGSLDVPIQR